MVVKHCVLNKLATRRVKIRLGKLAVGGVTDQNKNRHGTQFFQSRITGCSVVFQRNMFPKYLQTYYGIVCFSTVKQLHTEFLILLNLPIVKVTFQGHDGTFSVIRLKLVSSRTISSDSHVLIICTMLKTAVLFWM